MGLFLFDFHFAMCYNIINKGGVTVVLSREMNKLINELSEEKQLKILELMECESDRFIINYSILEIALEENLVSLDDDELLSFYNVDSTKNLIEVDRKIAGIIRTLEKMTKKNIYQEFYDNFSLDITEPELKYLISVTMEVVKWRARYFKVYY